MDEIKGRTIAILDKPNTHVSVPGGLRFVRAITNMRGPRGRRWLDRRTGTDRVPSGLCSER
jgi:hypothetical protein